MTSSEAASHQDQPARVSPAPPPADGSAGTAWHGLTAAEASPLQRIFSAVDLTSRPWGICLLGPLRFLVLAELEKLLDRQLERRHAA